MPDKTLDPVEFATRVEGLCTYILGRIDRYASHDALVVEKLRDDAADIATKKKSFDYMSLDGLDDHMRGMFTGE